MHASMVFEDYPTAHQEFVPFGKTRTFGNATFFFLRAIMIALRFIQSCISEKNSNFPPKIMSSSHPSRGIRLIFEFILRDTTQKHMLRGRNENTASTSNDAQTRVDAIEFRFLLRHRVTMNYSSLSRETTTSFNDVATQ